jgi:hypothetical protein
LGLLFPRLKWFIDFDKIGLGYICWAFFFTKWTGHPKQC